jgi:hypothetical protein
MKISELLAGLVNVAGCFCAADVIAGTREMRHIHGRVCCMLDAMVDAQPASLGGCGE